VLRAHRARPPSGALTYPLTWKICRISITEILGVWQYWAIALNEAL